MQILLATMAPRFKQKESKVMEVLTVESVFGCIEIRQSRLCKTIYAPGSSFKVEMVSGPYRGYIGYGRSREQATQSLLKDISEIYGCLIIANELRRKSQLPLKLNRDSF